MASEAERVNVFQPPGGSTNLWDLVFVINGQDDSLLPPSYSKGVMHMKHLLKFKTVSQPHTHDALLHAPPLTRQCQSDQQSSYSCVFY